MAFNHHSFDNQHISLYYNLTLYSECTALSIFTIIYVWCNSSRRVKWPSLNICHHFTLAYIAYLEIQSDSLFSSLIHIPVLSHTCFLIFLLGVTNEYNELQDFNKEILYGSGLRHAVIHVIYRLKQLRKSKLYF